jgi:hypothetical protein
VYKPFWVPDGRRVWQARDRLPDAVQGRGYAPGIWGPREPAEKRFGGRERGPSPAAAHPLCTVYRGRAGAPGRGLRSLFGSSGRSPPRGGRFRGERLAHPGPKGIFAGQGGQGGAVPGNYFAAGGRRRSRAGGSQGSPASSSRRRPSKARGERPPPGTGDRSSAPRDRAEALRLAWLQGDGALALGRRFPWRSLPR